MSKLPETPSALPTLRRESLGQLTDLNDLGQVVGGYINPSDFNHTCDRCFTWNCPNTHTHDCNSYGCNVPTYNCP